MILHNIELAWMHLKKYRLQSLVCIVSLAVGFACFALAMLWIRYERTYDKCILTELTLRKLMAAVSGVCILISLFGVWSMIMLNCEQRRKEIAVRKVFGATAGQVLRQFFGEYMLLLAVAAVVAFPIGYICMKPWVEQYVIQMAIPWWLYVGIFLANALLVILCIGWRVWKTVNAHPAEEISKG